MKMKLLYLFLILLIVGTVYGITLPSEEYKENVIPQGENGQAQLFPYTRTYVKLYEGTKLDFRIYNPTTGQELINNSLIIQKINIDNAGYKSIVLKSGDKEQMQLNFSKEKGIPFMFIKGYKYKYVEGAKDNYAVLYFNVPLFNIIKQEQPVPQGIDTTKATGGEVKTNYLPYALIAGIVLLVASIILYVKQKKPGKKEINKRQKIILKIKRLKNQVNSKKLRD